MVRRGRKRAAKVSQSRANERSTVQFEDRGQSFNEREVERRVAAIHAICEAETENLLSRLRLLRSYISNEQMETPALKFFQENLSNLTIIRNEKYKIFELTWNDRDGYIPGKDVDDRDMHISLGNAAKLSAVHGLQFSVNSVKKNFLEAANLHIPDFGLGEYSENQMAGAREAFQTPGAMSNRLSFGMTPKTLRLPQNGEMLLSVRGSPLGVYKEENLEAIHESGDDAS
ncbi:uncharacterized protein [Typha angustifolia]|uniref:uncharacterized protein isoform X1 n=1 Tax=Typha angustifolia TaxID=59011 RepID=UPI003C30705B